MRFCLLLLLTCCALLSPAPVAGQGGAPRARAATRARAVARGLSWLRRRQQERGAWSARRRDEDVAVSALAGLALLASGQPGSSPQERAGPRERLASYLLANQRRAEPDRGLLVDAGAPLAEPRGLMHGHGFALLYLSLLTGELREPSLARAVDGAVRAAVARSVAAQMDSGSWAYGSAGGRDECSVTAAQLQALWVAREAGYAVPEGALRRGAAYLASLQDQRGVLVYGRGRRLGSAGLTAAGLAALRAAPAALGPRGRDRALKALRLGLAGERALGDPARPYFYYAHFYACQVLVRQGEERFEAYFKAVEGRLIRVQGGDGAWSCESFGSVYATAMALIVLQAPRAYLPIFQP